MAYLQFDNIIHFFTEYINRNFTINIFSNLNYKLCQQTIALQLIIENN
jgi:hypothetical protein